MLHSADEPYTWQPRPATKAKALSAGCETALLTSSSLKTRVHLLHVVIVNQALRLCSFASFPPDMCFSSLYLLCYILPLPAEMYVFVYLLNVSLIADF